MLEDLEHVDWSALSHAYGPAVDVPDLIRAVASGTNKEKDAAWYALYGNIWHQGTVYEATVTAAPFFAELAANPNQDGLHEILNYLAAIADGSSFLDVHENYTISAEERAALEHQAKKKEELGWVRSVRETVRDSIKIYVEYLEHGEAAVRASAANLLSVFLEDANLTRPALAERFNAGDSNEAARASCVLAIARLSLKNARGQECLLRAFDECEPFSVRAIGAVGIAWTMREKTPEKIQQFIHKLSEENMQPVVQSFTWDAGDAADYFLNAEEAIRGAQ